MEPEDKIVICPGPVHLHPSVIRSAYPEYHRTGSFRKKVIEIEGMVRRTLETVHPVYLLTASGTGAMEAAVLNVTSPGTRVLVASAGKFGDRWAEIARAYGCDVRNERFEPGAVFDLSRLRGAMLEFEPECVALTHVESSTGARFPLEEFSRLMKASFGEAGPETNGAGSATAGETGSGTGNGREKEGPDSGMAGETDSGTGSGEETEVGDAYSGETDPVKSISRPVLIVDAIASAGAEDLQMDGWGIDVAVASGQKAFAGPAGVSFLAMNQRALEISRSSRREGYYFRATKYEKGREDGDTPFTPAIQSAQMLHYSLNVQAGIGWDKIRARHRNSSGAMVAAFRRLGLEEFPSQPSVSVKVMILPGDIDGELFLKELEKKYKIVAGKGQGQLKGRVIRFGFAGLYSGDILSYVVKSVGGLLKEKGLEVDLEAAEKEMDSISGQGSVFK